MKKKSILIYLLLWSQVMFAQVSVGPQVIASAGGNALTSNLQVSWTLGETFTTGLSNSGLSLSQGFQQNTSICVSIVDYQYVKAGNPYQTLFPLTNGMIINQIPEQVSILVTEVCSNLSIESFEMNLQGPEQNWNIVQNVTPNALFDNFGNFVNGRNFIPGNYTLTVTGYTQDNKGGNITYGPVITTFTVVGNLATISMPTLSIPNICAGSNVDVSFTTTGTFTSTNQFQIQLSDKNGSFEFPTVIGSANIAGTVTCTIPLNTADGSDYLIRVISSAQVFAGNPTMSMLTINPQNYNFTNPTNNYTSENLTKKAVSTITANNKISSSAQINYQAGNAIILKPGLEINAGAVFKADIKGCNN
jgi:hypothetical protein